MSTRETPLDAEAIVDRFLLKALVESCLVSAGGDLDAGIEAEQQGFGKVLGSEDGREGLSAFLEKRSARFKGA